MHRPYATARRRRPGWAKVGVMPTCLLVTTEPTLRDEALRLAAAAGVEPVVVADPAAALRCWTDASLVLVGTDLAPDLLQLGPCRRSGVHLVAWGTVPDEAFRHAVALGAENVAELPRSDAWLLDLFAEAGEGQAAESLVVGVLGGSGGSGATTFACALGLAAAERAAACLVDTDPLGPGADRVLGFDRVDGVRWDALQQTTGRISARALREALPRRKGLGVLTWTPGSAAPLQAFAVREALAAAARGHPVVVVDLARGGPLTDELVARCQLVVVTVRASVPGLASAAHLVTRLGGAEAGLVVRGSGVDVAEAARVVGAPVLTAMPHQRHLDETVDLGQGPVRSRRSVLARAAREVLDEAARRGTVS